jgi:hypothetical protein
MVFIKDSKKEFLDQILNKVSISHLSFELLFKIINFHLEIIGFC